MPTYDYACRACGEVIEVVHSMSEAGPTTCAACGGDLRRMFFPTGIIFKGSGFYRTDSRSASSASVAGGSTAPAPQADAASGGGAAPASGADQSAGD